MSINELFGTNEMSANHGARSLPGTAELTSVAHNAAIRMMKAMETDIDAFRDRIQLSTTDARELDALIDELCDYNIEDESVLRFLSDEQVESMLKSQQSKRSRTKSKSMTVDNYITLLTAAIAETILRDIYNKPKAAAGFHRSTGGTDYTIEQLEALSADQNALRKEIRNIQSKKSIMKSKADFDESDPRWQALLKAEQQLKDMRVGGRSGVVEVDKTKNALDELLAGKDISKMKSAEAHELLERIAKLTAGDENPEPVDDGTAEEIQ